MNPHLSGFDAALIVVVTVEAAVGLVVQFRASAFSSILNRVLAVATASLCAGYVAAYQILFWSDVDPGEYQSVLRGMGVVLWLLAVIVPPVIRRRSRLGDQIVEAVERRLIRP